jgi:hypothetical protein
MPHSRHLRQLPPLLSAALLLLALPAAATTYMMVDDATLAAQAPAIAEVSVESVDISPAKGWPATDYLVSVEQVIQGNLPGSSLIVRVPGGQRPDGVGLKIWGAPELAPGERALLFLAPNRDGSFRILHLMMGVFREVRATDGSQLAVRDLAEATEVRLPGAPDRAAERGARDLGKFRDWLIDRALGTVRPPDYFTARQPVQGLAAPSTFFTRGGLKMRWFEFDQTQSVSWRANNGGQPSVPGGGFAEFQNALNAWNRAGGVNVRYSYAGQTSASSGLDSFDNINAILFNHQLDDVFSCETGGVLAIGGPWFNASDHGTSRGETFIRIGGADIVTNAGLECFFERSPDPRAAAEELFGHELGHTLGLGHSCGDPSSGPCNGVRSDALMRASIHDDGRGARLNADDLAGIRTLYGTGAPPPPPGHGPAAPGNLKATVTGRTIRLDWLDHSSNERGFKIYRSVFGGTLALVATLPPNIKTYTDANLAGNTRYTYQISSFNNKGESRSAVISTPRTARNKAGIAGQ